MADGRMVLFERDPVPCNHSLVEREARFRAVPVDEFERFELADVRLFKTESRQERLFSTTVGGDAATAELAYQIVGDRRRSKSLKLAGFASPLADRPALSTLRSQEVGATDDMRRDARLNGTNPTAELITFRVPR